jgi:hypothetical protein
MSNEFLSYRSYFLPPVEIEYNVSEYGRRK